MRDAGVRRDEVDGDVRQKVVVSKLLMTMTSPHEVGAKPINTEDHNTDDLTITITNPGIDLEDETKDSERDDYDDDHGLAEGKPVSNLTMTLTSPQLTLMDMRLMMT